MVICVLPNDILARTAPPFGGAVLGAVIQQTDMRIACPAYVGLGSTTAYVLKEPFHVMVDVANPVSSYQSFLDGRPMRFIAIQEISKEYQQQETNLHSPMDGSARKPQQYLAEVGTIT